MKTRKEPTIKVLRQYYGLSQGEFAKILDVPQSSLCLYERDLDSNKKRLFPGSRVLLGLYSYILSTDNCVIDYKEKMDQLKKITKALHAESTERYNFFHKKRRELFKQGKLKL